MSVFERLVLRALIELLEYIEIRASLNAKVMGVDIIDEIKRELEANR